MVKSIGIPDPVVFESTESVIEILWDIALAVFVIRLAFIYVGLTVAAVALFSWAAKSLLPPLPVHLPESLSRIVASCSSSGSASGAEHVLTVLALALPAVAIPALCARFINGYYQIPRVASYRLAVGAMSLVYIVLGSLLASLFVPAHLKHSHHHHVDDEGASRILGDSGCSLYQAHVALAALFAASVTLMPCLSMWLLEGRSRSATTETNSSSSAASILPSQSSEKRVQPKSAK